MPEEVNEDVEAKPAAKKTVRKTIRRVRKAAPKREKDEGSAEAAAEDAGRENAPAAESRESMADQRDAETAGSRAAGAQVERARHTRRGAR